MENISQMSLLEIAVLLMEQKQQKYSIKELIQEVLALKGIEDSSGELATKLYIDITTSSKFVYMGNEEWDLKSRQSLDEFDKDGSAFNTKEAEIDEEPLDEEELEDEVFDEDEYDSEDEDEEDEDDEDEYDSEDEDEEDEDDEDYEDDEDSIIDGDITERYSEDDFNEDKYNDLMDDYEDMYEE